ncbi:3-methyladenine DNA glycosylase AlkD [Ereboglobus sp. PH5-5]|uniref:DNA alkylation repair protein n=1 Tax=Ereboglobus sp. PH5-5 TaxID=2940529 RepID=UPI002404B9A8|nr:DNA alkylation repair protein [Ereboglobus sp. PH5-5]MDF9832281.1 3-methyladenine DNA glycosylase AlkD [Ereboglobus sp. PH5-5]
MKKSKAPVPPAKNPRLLAGELVAKIRAQFSQHNVDGQRRFGITPSTEQLGVSMAYLRQLARGHRRDQELSLALWAITPPIHEARLLAALTGDPGKVTRRQMDAWARTFDSWDICDICCIHLFRRAPFAFEKAAQWSARNAAKDTFVKRAGFALMASLAVHAKDEPDTTFLAWLPVIRREANDDRNFVRKAVNWALRQIGKRNPRLRRAAIAEARRIRKMDTKAARWIAADALRELESLP